MRHGRRKYSKWAQALSPFLLLLAWLTFWLVKDMLWMGIAIIPVLPAVVTLVAGLDMFAGSCAVFKTGMGKYPSNTVFARTFVDIARKYKKAMI
ncbi:MAG: hypothetical protein K2N44_07705 [Lachnospiraceae bacterium]|nr:hypothetical protein [Lachnospiraceae bacterium]